MYKIKVDIDELLDKLEEVKNDDFATVELTIDTDDDGYKELLVSAVSFDEDEPINYGIIGENEDEL